MSSYKKILDSLLRETSRLDVQLGVCEQLREVKSEEADALEAAPVLFGLMLPAMTEGVLLGLARLYDQNGDRSMWKLLNVAQGTIKQISWARAPTHAELAQQHAALARHESTLDTLRTLRDKAIAHHDKEFSDDPSTFSSSNQVPVEDVISLLRATQKLLGQHCTWIGEPWRMSMADVVAVGTQRMADDLLRLHRDKSD